MEADWEVEIGPGAPVIDALWSGLVDLRQSPERVQELSEVVALPALGRALVALNGAGSPVWTSKCDFWPELESGAYDPDEMDTDSAISAAAGCFIDMLAIEGREWSSAEDAVNWGRSLCAYLRAAPLRGCRVDLVVRQAVMGAEGSTFGITAYVTGAGISSADAVERLAVAVEIFPGAVSKLE